VALTATGRLWQRSSCSARSWALRGRGRFSSEEDRKLRLAVIVRPLAADFDPDLKTTHRLQPAGNPLVGARKLVVLSQAFDQIGRVVSGCRVSAAVVVRTSSPS